MAGEAERARGILLGFLMGDRNGGPIQMALELINVELAPAWPILMTEVKKIDDAKPAAVLPPLSNTIFQALATRQAGFSQTAGKARRFLPEIGPLAGFSEPADPDFDALAQLACGGPVVIFLDAPFQPRAGWKAVDGAPLVLMVWRGTGLPEEDSCAPILKLSVEDSADMLELTAMTKPGPFGPRTHELGSFFGIRIGNRLASMAGERLKVDGYTEVSAVCTHPDHLGKGYAAALMRTVMRGILERGETPFFIPEPTTRGRSHYTRGWVSGIGRPVISWSLRGNEGYGRAPRLKL